MHGKNDMLAISKEEFANGYCVYMFKLTPDLSMLNANEGAVHLAMKMRFRKKLPENVMLILYAVFNGLVEINDSREAFSNIY